MFSWINEVKCAKVGHCYWISALTEGIRFRWWYLAGIWFEWCKCADMSLRVCVNDLAHHEADIWIGSVWCIAFENSEVECAGECVLVWTQVGSLYIYAWLFMSCGVHVCELLCCAKGWTGKIMSLCPTGLILSFPCRSQLTSSDLTNFDSPPLYVSVWMCFSAHLWECLNARHHLYVTLHI